MVEQNQKWEVEKQITFEIVNEFPEQDRVIRETAYLKVVKNKETGFRLVALQKKNQAFRLPFKDLVRLIENLMKLKASV